MDKKYKNLILILAVILTIVLVLIIVLSKKKEETSLTYGGWGTDIYTGFYRPQQGGWSELIIKDEEGKESLQRSIYLGEATIEGILSYGVEVDANVLDNKGAILQIWYDENSDEIIKMVSKMKQGKEVTCVSANLMGLIFPAFKDYLPSVFTPLKYSSLNDYTYGTYTTESGKTIRVAKFIDEYQTEIWVSSEVPFGIVKGVHLPTNTTVVRLRDFGLSGATPVISKTEMMSCTAGAL
ncbi:MAG: hypothetical protein PHF45_01115 [Candidatus Pacebacteria bacterium]|nr:hypothetical protein [Candidatus Paceibacterota bacterium]